VEVVGSFGKLNLKQQGMFVVTIWKWPNKMTWAVRLSENVSENVTAVTNELSRDL
jgi:hypothetical protein